MNIDIRKKELEKLKLELKKEMLFWSFNYGCSSIGILECLSAIEGLFQGKEFLISIPVLFTSLINAFFADIYSDKIKENIPKYNTLKLEIKENINIK